MSKLSLQEQAKLGPLGRNLLKMIDTVRPPLLDALEREGRLFKAISEAEAHFTHRQHHHGAMFDRLHPEPMEPEEVLRRISLRENYINSEVGREMLNWIHNYPDVRLARA